MVKPSQGSPGCHIVACFSARQPPDCTEWFLDSGASNHFSYERRLFSNFQELSPAGSVSLGNDYRCPILGSGTVHLSLANGQLFVLDPVLYVPTLTKNLLSTIALGQLKTYRIVIEDDVTRIMRKDDHSKTLMTGHPCRGLVLLDAKSVIQEPQGIYASQMDHQLTELWHKRLGHLSVDTLKTMKLGNHVTGFPEFKVVPIPICEPCLHGKQHQDPYHRSITIYSKPLELVYSDVCGPMEARSLGHSLYFVTFIDAYSGYTCLYFLKHKSETFDKFQQWLVYAERHTQTKLQTLQSDNGGEYKSTSFLDFCKQAGIERRFTVPYTPQQMGAAEKRNRDLNDHARSMLAQASLPKSYWAEAVATAVHIQNRVPKKPSGQTPMYLWSGRVPDISYFRTFGCATYTHIPKHLRSKWDSHTVKLRFVGYGETTKGYKLLDPTSLAIRYARNVRFNETDFFLDTSSDPALEPEGQGDQPGVVFPDYDNYNPDGSNSDAPEAEENLPADMSLLRQGLMTRIQRGLTRVGHQIINQGGQFGTDLQSEIGRNLLSDLTLIVQAVSVKINISSA